MATGAVKEAELGEKRVSTIYLACSLKASLARCGCRGYGIGQIPVGSQSGKVFRLQTEGANKEVAVS